MSDKCPKCQGDLHCLGGHSAHPLNWYCVNEQSCGWEAWAKGAVATPIVKFDADDEFTDANDPMFVMSMYVNKTDLHEAKAKYYMEKTRELRAHCKNLTASIHNHMESAEGYEEQIENCDRMMNMSGMNAHLRLMNAEEEIKDLKKSQEKKT
jgi:hypothetical protein